jgi:hypothetical protein
MRRARPVVSIKRWSQRHEAVVREKSRAGERRITSPALSTLGQAQGIAELTCRAIFNRYMAKNWLMGEVWGGQSDTTGSPSGKTAMISDKSSWWRAIRDAFRLAMPERARFPATTLAPQRLQSRSPTATL